MSPLAVLNRVPCVVIHHGLPALEGEKSGEAARAERRRELTYTNADDADDADDDVDVDVDDRS